MKKLLLFPVLLLLASCASIPRESVDLAEAIRTEGERMHRLNVMLVTEMFEEKKDAIDAFIRDDYTPAFVANFKNEVPQDTDYEAEFTGMMSAIIPIINERRDAMQSALEEERIRLISSLDADYAVYLQASTDLRALLQSSVDVKESRSTASARLAALTGNKVDINRVEGVLDNFISGVGEAGLSDIGTAIENMTNAFNEINKD